jgi:hypothetical protein
MYEKTPAFADAFSWLRILNGFRTMNMPYIQEISSLVSA